LKAGGLYAIEDRGIGYLDDFADGRKFDPKAVLPERLRRINHPFPCHSYGMVGFVKELVDEQGASSIKLGRNEQIRRSKFERLLVTPGVIFVGNWPLLLRISKSRAYRRRAGATMISWNI